MYSEQEIDQILHTLSGGRVLDVATGMGHCIGWMKEALKDYTDFTGVDATDITTRPDQSVFEAEDVRFALMDAHHLEFEDHSFDTVTISYSLHHLADPRQALSEMKRVLKPGGHLIVTEMYNDNQTDEQLTHVFLHHWWAAIDTALGITHNQTFARQPLIDLLDGLEMSEMACYDFADLESDPKDPETRDLLRGNITRYLDRAKDLPNLPAIQARAAELSERLDTIGHRHATALVAIGVK